LFGAYVTAAVYLGRSNGDVTPQKYG